MKKLLIAFAATMSLMVGIVGSAAAAGAGADSHACQQANTAGITNGIAAHAGGCVDHP